MLLTFKLLRLKNVRRCEDVFHKLDDWSVSDWAVAFAGEAGETCDACKKYKRYFDGTNTEKDPKTEEECIEKIAMELADTIIYADLLAAKLNIDLETAIKKKFNIVSKRMKSGIMI